MNVAELQSVLRQAGWPQELIVPMAAVGMAESSGNPRAINDGSGTRSNEYSVGLWQINMKAHGTRYGTKEQLFDPLTNARAALAIYRMQGLKAWGAYTDGRYKQYLSASAAAAGSILPHVPSVGGLSTPAMYMLGALALLLILRR